MKDNGNDNSNKKKQKVTPKPSESFYPESRQSHSKQKQKDYFKVTGVKHLPLPINPATKQKDFMERMFEVFEKSQEQIKKIGRQLINIQERQEKINNSLINQAQKSQLAKSQIFQLPLTNFMSKSQDFEMRDRFHYIDIPTKLNSDNYEEIQRWIEKVFTKTFSIAFHRFSKQEMTFQQTKIFCSMNILNNLTILYKKHTITSQTIQMLDQYLRTDLLIYLQKKYPLTESQEINKNLENTVQEIDNLGSLSNNYFAISEIMVEYRDDGNYNDLIMKMINDISSKIDQKSMFDSNKRNTNFNDFKKYMSKVFDIVEEQDQLQSMQQEIVIPTNFANDKIIPSMKSSLRDYQNSNQRQNTKDSSKIRQAQRQKYKNKVKQYTHYSIGRKIPEKIVQYSNKQIQSMNLQIKNPTIFRILTKWCQQLRKKFTTTGYFLNYSDNIKVQRSNIVNSLLFPMRIILDQQLKKQQEMISEYMKGISKNNYQMQLQLLKKEINKYEFIQLEQIYLEKICGRYSIEMINNLHSYLIAYLNRLIHGLMNVANRFYERSGLKSNSNWPAPPDLLTFTIGDLMRCKISSKERQIMRIYHHIRYLSLKNPQKIKIIRIKNRLKLSTNDILINIKFNNLIICQIQLAVKTQTSQFIKCSNTFCHYLYQLQRSPFGSIAQLCNIWAYLDRRAEIYRELMEIQAEKPLKRRLHTCKENFKKTPFNKPFICHQCNVAYYHNYYIRNHIQCLNCMQVICFKCQLKQQKQETLMDALIVNKHIRKSCDFMINRLETSSQLFENDLPEFGVCIYIQSKFPKVEIFRLIIYNNQRYILGSNGQKTYEIQKIQTEKELAVFMRKYVIFKLNNNRRQHLNIQLQEAIQSYILPKILNKAYKSQKESIVLGDKLSNKVIKNVLSSGKAERKEKITKLFMDNNRIEEIDQIVGSFKQLKVLQLSQNPLKNLDCINQLKYLKSLSLVNCKLQCLPLSVLDVLTLQSLSLCNNLINQLPTQIQNLKQLKILQISDNKLKVIPSSIGRCSGLQILRCENNQLTDLPSEISLLKQLRMVFLRFNRIKAIPSDFGKLVDLQGLDISFNELEYISESLGQLSNLVFLNVQGNKIAKIQNIAGLVELIDLNISENVTLQALPNTFALLAKLQNLNCQKCMFGQIPPQICKLSTLKSLNLSANKLISIDDDLKNLIKLQIINFSQNQIQIQQQKKQIFAKMINLKKIDLSHNQIQIFPSFYFCQKISSINLSYNNLVQISESDTAGLNSLEYLDISHNKIKEISNNITLISKLKEFDASHNNIKEIGIDIEDNNRIWPNLYSINLEQNQLSEVPPCLLKSQKIGNLENLTKINISHNRLEKIPNELAHLKKLRGFLCNSNNVKQVTNELYNLLIQKKVETDMNEIKFTNQELSPVRKKFPRKDSKKT